MQIVEFLLMIVLLLLAVFLIVLVLIQRGKGGGLAGALGGMGGQSAFGTKAGDLFTRITIGVAAAWIILCIVSLKVLSVSSERLNLGSPTAGQEQSDTTDGSQPKSVPESGSQPAGGSNGAESHSAPAPAAPAESDGAKK